MTARVRVPNSIAALALVFLIGAAPDAVDRAAAQILTYKQYASIDHRSPYILEFSTNRGALLLYGARHTGDPSDPQIADIAERWKRFAPTVAYNEGGDPPTLSDPKAAVQKFGEPGYLRFLAARDTVPIATFEPPFASEIAFLKARYTAEQIKVFYTLRQVAEARTRDTGASVDSTVLGDLTKWLPQYGLAGPPNTVEEFTAASARLFPKLADWRTVSNDWFDPTQSLAYTNEMASESGTFRDAFIFRLLVRRALRGDRVFAVIGASHVVVQENALRAVLGEPRVKVNGLSYSHARSSM